MASPIRRMRLNRLNRPVRITDHAWPDGTPPLVSILCTAYNHAQYIGECLDGFLSQETTFPVEIIVHDDASTDGTQTLVAQYAKRFPGIIKTCFQDRNQLSQGKKPTVLAFAYAIGEYIALCEGDDFWIDHTKLERQINEMQSQPGCDISFHPALAEYYDSMRDEEIICQHKNTNFLFPPEEIIRGDGGFCPTASLMIRRAVFENLPNCFFDAPVGDYYLQILGSLRNGALYLNKVMAAYRVRTPNSWANRMTDKTKRMEFHIRTIYTLYEFNAWLDYSYNTAFTDRILDHSHLLLETLEYALPQTTQSANAAPAPSFEPLGAKHRIFAYLRRIRRFGIKRTLSHSISNILFTWTQHFRAIADRQIDN